jgi:hypothetical protein
MVMYSGIADDGPDDGRRINGKPLSTHEDWARWWVLKGFSDEIFSHLCSLLDDITKGKCKSIPDARDEWKAYYSRYRALCIRYGIWNLAIEDRLPFMPTSRQLDYEKAVYSRLDHAVQNGNRVHERLKEEQRDYDDRSKKVLEYIDMQYKHSAVRHVMLSSLSADNLSEKSAYLKTCQRLVREEVLSESHNDANKIVLRKKRVNRKAVTLVTQSPQKSVFSKEWYACIPEKTLYKVEYTVGLPTNLDTGNNRCTFKSQSCGAFYCTSLTECSCAAFKNDPSIPCKHMVALAIHLGYLN